jgi:formylmethanofuran dehydrogenase subunit E
MVLRHQHQYQRSHKTKNGTTIYKCSHPECSSTTTAELLKGKANVCDKCMEKFIMDSYAMKLAKPVCRKCRGKSEPRKIEYNLENINL